jgi:hypothetical protein
MGPEGSPWGIGSKCAYASRRELSRPAQALARSVIRCDPVSMAGR